MSVSTPPYHGCIHAETPTSPVGVAQQRAGGRTSCTCNPFVEQAHSIFYILQDYSSLTLVERRGGWVLEVVVVVGEQEMDDY